MKIVYTSIPLCGLFLAAGCYDPPKRSYYRVAPVVEYRAAAPGEGLTAVSAEAATDRLLENRLRHALRQDPDTIAYAPGVQVTSSGGTVTLTGTAPTTAARDEIENVVRNTAGVMSVVDQISVPLAPTGRVEPVQAIRLGDSGEIFNLHVEGLSNTDRALAQNVLSGLRTDTVLVSMLPVVDIHVSDGRVTLRGHVLNDEQRRAVVTAVERAAGTGNVVDELRIQPAR